MSIHWYGPFGIGFQAQGDGVRVRDRGPALQKEQGALLRYNPVAEKIHVLVHRSKAMAESLVIIDYVDETWKDGYPIMPKHALCAGKSQVLRRATATPVAAVLLIFRSINQRNQIPLHILSVF
ncbi:hypothetical protein BHE74_00048362 [Ensete ventricosum]|nr:hypothetical protein BHE74_00048362 [Ensete ventricosum]